MSAPKFPVTVELSPTDKLLLNAIATYFHKTESTVVSEALHVLFAVLPRPGDTAPLERDHVSEASKPGGAT